MLPNEAKAPSLKDKLEKLELDRRAKEAKEVKKETKPEKKVEPGKKKK